MNTRRTVAARPTPRIGLPVLVVTLLAGCGAETPVADGVSTTADGMVDAAPVLGPDAGPSPADALCTLWRTPMIEDLDTEYPEDCAALPAPRSFQCGEYWLWLGLRERFDERLAILDRLAAILETEAASLPENAEWAGRMQAYRGMLAMATMLENGEQSLAPTILPAFEAAHALAPENRNLALWPDTLEIAFAWLAGDRERVRVAAERAFGRVDACGFVNLVTLGGTTIGLPLDTGYPQRTIAALDAYRCEGADFCTHNTWRAPYARPGLSYQLAEAYARVGNGDRARSYLADALSAPGAETWAYRPMVQATLDELDAVLAEYAALGQDKGAFLSAFSNTRNGCVFCHAPHPPLENVPTGRLPVRPDPEPGAPRPSPTPEMPPVGEPVDADDPAIEALLGTWIQQVDDARVTVTPIGEQTVASRTWSLVTYSIVEGVLQSETRACRAHLGQTAGLTLTVSETVLQARPPLVARVTPRRLEADGRLLLVAEEVCDALGYQPVGDATEETVPVRGDDPRLRDVDADGHPGLTLTLSTEAVAYHMYVARRTCSALHLEVGGEPHALRGQDHAVHGEQHVLGADVPVFATDLPSWPAPDPAAHGARLRRAPEGTTCASDLASAFSDD
jgi:hypothetical protein